MQVGAPKAADRLDIEAEPMVSGNLFLSEQHAVSRRHAVLEDNGLCGWLYLTDRDSTRPVADVWVFNRIPPPPLDQVRSYAPSPPPAAIGFADELALVGAPHDVRWSLLWSPDGDAVAVVKGGEPVAFVRSGRKHGYCRHLLRDGPWGSVWSDEVFDEAFRQR